MAYPHHISFTDNSWDKQFDEPILSIDLVRIYFLVRGRNAWWSTWVKNYTPDCLHCSLESAKQQAERMRGPGSVFYIEEIPGIIVRSDKWVALVTQININIPFEQYSLKCLDNSRKRAESRRLKIFLRKGMQISRALKSFDPYGKHWKTSQPTKNNIIIEYGERDDVSHDHLWSSKPKPIWQQWKSYAPSSNYYLGWTEIMTKLDPEPAKLLVRKANQTKPWKPKKIIEVS